MNRKNTLLFEQKKRALYNAKNISKTHIFKNIRHLTPQQQIRLIKLLRSLNSKEKIAFFLSQKHKIIKRAETDYEKGKAVIAYYRSIAKKAQERKFVKKKK